MIHTHTDHIHIYYGEHQIIYDHGLSKHSTLPDSCNIYIADIAHDSEQHFFLLQHTKATIVMPFPTVSQDRAIDFASIIMRSQLSTPKFLKE
jgi:hypothetical protein